VVEEIVTHFTGENFDLDNYRLNKDREKEYINSADGGLYELVEIKTNDLNQDNEVTFTITLRKKWDLDFDSHIVDLKQLSPRDWRSRVIARDANRVEVGSIRYNLNDRFSAGPAVIRNTDYIGNIPRGDDNPKKKIYVGGSIKVIFK
tara:strand:+ start:13916 stop:14356 length:441 start_codon:yes stop_codon:yes gene_type:complete